MRMARGAWLLALVAAGAAAQTSPPQAAPAAEKDVVVQGVRSKPSNWYEAETAHVLIQSDGPKAELVTYARDLERLHFLLSGLLGRSSTADDLVKIRITMIGDVAQFTELDLRNRRWQQGPFNDLFQLTRYYDPREDGAVMATTRVDQRQVIEHSQNNAASTRSVLSSLALSGTAPASQGSVGGPAGQVAIEGAIVSDFATAGMQSAHDLTVTYGEHAIEVPAESLLLAGYAQHYLLSYFPAAYPRWYLDGFGQIFASMKTKGDHVLTFGESPKGTQAVLDEFGGYPIGKVLDDSYLTANPHHTSWTPIHAWMIAHFLLFSDTRRPQLRQYLAQRAAGVEAAKAAEVFGDPKVLAKELQRYFSARKPYEQITYSPQLIDEPTVRRLSEGEAAFIRGRLELGSRIVLPPAPDASTPPDRARAMQRAYDEAVRGREAWLERLRREADRWSNDIDAQLLLAEAECRSGNADRCATVANRAIALSPKDSRPLAWKGLALAELAAAAPADQRATKIAEARRVIGAANHLDNDAVEPLLAYYQSFVEAGEAPPVVAIDALQKAVGEVPDAPESRLQLASALAARGQYAVARQVILPVAAGPYDSPERPAARAIAAKAGPEPEVPAPADANAPASDHAAVTPPTNAMATGSTSTP